MTSDILLLAHILLFASKSPGRRALSLRPLLGEVDSRDHAAERGAHRRRVRVRTPGGRADVLQTVALRELSFMYRYISRESCSQFDSLPLTSLTISGGDGALQSFTSASYGALPVHRTELSGPSDAVSVPWRRFCDPSCVILVVASASINAVFTSWLALLPILTTNAPQVSFYVPLHFTRILLTV